MKRIWKYEIPIVDHVELRMPLGARLLHFGDQDGVLNLWALIDDEQATEVRLFAVIGTGSPISEDAMLHLAHVGTAIQPRTLLVWHLFEARPW